MKLQGTSLLAETSGLPRWAVFPVGLVLVIALGFVDYAAPGRMSFTLLYLIVCVAAGWAAGPKQAISLAVIAGLTIGWVEWMSTRSNPMLLILGWNTFCRIAVFAIVSWLAAEATRLTRHLHRLVQERTEQLETEVARHTQSLAALQEAESRYRSLAETSPDNIFIFDKNLRISYANTALASMLDCRAEKLIGRAQEEVFMPALGRLHVQMDQKVRATGQAVTRDIYTTTPSGKRWFETRLIPLGGKSGAADHIMGIARDITERKRNELFLQIQRDVAARLSLTSDLESALNSLLELATAIEGIDSGGIYLFDHDAGLVRLCAHRGLSGEFVRAVGEYSPESAQGRLVLAGQPAYFDRSMLDQDDGPTPKAEGLRSLAAIPLRHEDQVLGCLNLASHHFDSAPEMSRILMELLAAQAAGAIARIRAEQALEASFNERHRLERQLLEISEREQARIGQEIHDGLCQQLVSLAFDANTLEAQLRGKHGPETGVSMRLAKYLDASITEARRLSRGLFPIRLEGEGLSPAIEELVRSTGERFGISCQFKVDPLRIADAAVATNLYRIAQEALNNVVKHSRAATVMLELREHDDHIELRIEDNGIGLPPGRTASSRRRLQGTESGGGMGLHIMDYRARLIGGSLWIEPRPGGGTMISCLVPRGDADRNVRAPGLAGEP